MQEHRWNMRVAVDIPVRIEFPDNATVSGTAQDISFQGLYVDTDELPGTAETTVPVVVRMPAPRKRREEIEVPAVVVRTTDSGLGLLLFDYGDRVFDGIAEHIQTSVERHGRPRTQALR